MGTRILTTKFVYILLLSVILLIPCRQESAFGASLSLRDSLGRDVEISQPIRRIVALNSDCLEVLRILKADDRVVGVFSDIIRERSFWGKLTEKPKTGKWNEPNFEAIAALKPDLVIAYGSNPGSFLEEKLKSFAIPVLRLDFYKIQTLEWEVRLLGKLLGQQSEASRFCDWHRRYSEIIRATIAATSERPAVYIENYSDYRASGANTGGNEMCLLAGGKNIADSFAIPFPLVTPEWVISSNPQVIVKAVSYGNGYVLKNAEPFNRKRADIIARPAWNLIEAVASGKIHVIDGAIWTGPRAIIGIAYMASWFHPGILQELNPEAMHREYLESFQGIPYQGVYVSTSQVEGSR